MTHVNKQISEMKTFSALQCLIQSFILQVLSPPWLRESESQSVCSPLQKVTRTGDEQVCGVGVFLNQTSYQNHLRLAENET